MSYRLFAIFIFFIVSCGRQDNDPRLIKIAENISVSPKEALADLDAINSDALNDSDRHLYDFLTIKAKDKAGITHMSDSLILDVIDYYKIKSEDMIYPEVLFYGGRVYSDLEDYMSAVKYFQEALSILSDDNSNQRLRCNILIQMGTLFNRMELFDYAVSYLKEAVENNRLYADTLDMAYCNNLLGEAYAGLKNYDSAESAIKKSIALTRQIAHPDSAAMLVSLSVLASRKGDADAALGILHSVSEAGRRPYFITPRVADIYIESNVLDTAYLIAHELATSSGIGNRKAGYGILLSSELRNMVPLDSLNYFFGEYKNTLELSVSENELKIRRLLKSNYDYWIYEEEKNKTMKTERMLKDWIAGFSVLTLLLVSKNLFKKILLYKSRIVLMRESLSDIMQLRKSLSDEQMASDAENGFSINENDICENNQFDRSALSSNKRENLNTSIKYLGKNECMLREKLRKELIALFNSSLNPAPVSTVITCSHAYEQILGYLKNNKPISETNPVWNDLEVAVVESSKEFKIRLQLLTGGCSEEDYHLALLIKSGFTTTQLSVLIGRTKSTISYRRKGLCAKLLGNGFETKAIDTIIRAI